MNIRLIFLCAILISCSLSWAGDGNETGSPEYPLTQRLFAEPPESAEEDLADEASDNEDMFASAHASASRNSIASARSQARPSGYVASDEEGERDGEEDLENVGPADSANGIEIMTGFQLIALATRGQLDRLKEYHKHHPLTQHEIEVLFTTASLNENFETCKWLQQINAQRRRIQALEMSGSAT